VYNLFVANAPVWLRARGCAMVRQVRQAAAKQLGIGHQIAGAAWLKVSDAIV
jgi:hypothetical protein